MALGLTQSLNRNGYHKNHPWVKRVAGAYRWQSYHRPWADYLDKCGNFDVADCGLSTIFVPFHFNIWLQCTHLPHIGQILCSLSLLTPISFHAQVLYHIFYNNDTNTEVAEPPIKLLSNVCSDIKHCVPIQTDGRTYIFVPCTECKHLT
jgi:hypothetical protein